MFGIPKRHNIFETKSLFHFIALSIILAASCWLFLLENFRVYRAEVSILFLPKSELVVAQTGQILENLAELPRQLAFYDRLLEDGEISDPYGGRNQDERKKLWNKSLHIKQGKKGSVITIGVDLKKRGDSATVSKQIVKTLFASTSRYYDIKKDIDLRVIDGPIISPVIKNLVGLILLSLVLGLILAYLISISLQAVLGFISEIGQKLPQKKASIRREILFPKLPSIEKNLSFIKKTQPAIKQHGAPDNLPIATGPYPFDGKSLSHQEIAAEEINEPKTIPEDLQSAKADLLENSEPTEEELKRRLNQLIRGEF